MLRDADVLTHSFALSPSPNSVFIFPPGSLSINLYIYLTYSLFLYPFLSSPLSLSLSLSLIHTHSLYIYISPFPASYTAYINQAFISPCDGFVGCRRNAGRGHLCQVCRPICRPLRGHFHHRPALGHPGRLGPAALLHPQALCGPGRLPHPHPGCPLHCHILRASQVGEAFMWKKGL